MALLLNNLSALQASVYDMRSEGATIALIPTMGALHAGHLSLVKSAQNDGCKTIVSIFVNPKQFGPNEDYDRYPKQPESDCEMLDTVGADVIYVPDVSEMYPEGFQTSVRVAGLTEILCGASREGHFDGVCTVVLKLLLQTLVDRAYFGEKDFQQLLVVRRMVADLNLPIEIMGCPIVREGDGLAMSSRNAYLSSEDREKAAQLIVALREASGAINGGEEVEVALQNAKNFLKREGIDRIDYLELCHGEDLRSLQRLERPARLLAAVHVGNTRLIDNIEV